MTLIDSLGNGRSSGTAGMNDSGAVMSGVPERRPPADVEVVLRGQSRPAPASSILSTCPVSEAHASRRIRVTCLPAVSTVARARQPVEGIDQLADHRHAPADAMPSILTFSTEARERQ
ncbi:hypothetical protein [Micromonospora globbae]|uniref:hypothetical protein n=1 Tax=Micromonospora globbae TaxID=1894969 RepID=UPI0038699376|nr:hypothetical protein OH732_15260 [Micromonospora globbae]